MLFQLQNARLRAHVGFVRFILYLGGVIPALGVMLRCDNGGDALGGELIDGAEARF